MLFSDGPVQQAPGPWVSGIPDYRNRGSAEQL
ncbi:hypothetical protein Rrhod_2558 [Rhodococcus rhodnii LMG 5362]|uniref:Uncharacterized protein n=1 Tax=Rhodococcus rhodnii LMG 5362 TaxID=1273125 RepID=R7WLL3_9NOCA|nr:hypothetical protein Rrhod_2558 [Rhodococcus rhodnii LMG 5362]